MKWNKYPEIKPPYVERPTLYFVTASSKFTKLPYTAIAWFDTEIFEEDHWYDINGYRTDTDDILAWAVLEYPEPFKGDNHERT